MESKRVEKNFRAVLSVEVQGYSCLMANEVVTVNEYYKTISSLVEQLGCMIVASTARSLHREGHCRNPWRQVVG